MKSLVIASALVLLFNLVQSASVEEQPDVSSDLDAEVEELFKEYDESKRKFWRKVGNFLRKATPYVIKYGPSVIKAVGK